MTISIIPTLQNHYVLPEPHQSDRSPYCTLLWRRGQLLVKSPKHIKQPYLPSLYNEELLVECLKHSPIKLVSIDSKLGETWVKFWAEACEQANKPIFLRLPSGNQRLKKGNSLSRKLQRVIDGIAALVLLILVSPVMLGLILLMQVYSPGSIFSHDWQVGECGRLFRAIKFCTNEGHNITPLGRWMRQYNLQNLPQLFNVVQGDRGLIGSRCWTLEDAVRLSLEAQKELNQLPNAWEINPEINLLNLDGQTL
ncbi:heterocyst development glycosyltransferase HepC [Calothrix sp. NIES-2098]|uniref:heterocyst development glycosyltransferase HepC n=1 Tax=Calothrix sp. NIES-2098 TaxID=1954171 RepID=UPI000B5DC2BA|nr:sugar transferase [Calothrix sp. NIES-2098]